VDDFYPYRPLTDLFRPIGHLYAAMSHGLLHASSFSRRRARLEKQVLTLFAAFSYLVEAASQRHQGTEELSFHAPFFASDRAAHC